LTEETTLQNQNMTNIICSAYCFIFIRNYPRSV